MINHIKKARAVLGSVNAQYTQKRSWITTDSFHWSDGTANRAAKKVPGRKAIVMTAIVFIDELSSLDDLASCIATSASWRVIRLKS